MGRIGKVVGGRGEGREEWKSRPYELPVTTALKGRYVSMRPGPPAVSSWNASAGAARAPLHRRRAPRHVRHDQPPAHPRPPLFRRVPSLPPPADTPISPWQSSSFRTEEIGCGSDSAPKSR